MRRINIKVVPGAKGEQLQIGLDGNCKLWVRAKPVEGQANRAVIEVLMDYFGVSESAIRIISGQKSRHKIVEIGD